MDGNPWPLWLLRLPTLQQSSLCFTENNQFRRKRLAAAKLRLVLGGLPDICEPIPAKPKWTRRRTYQHIRNEIQALEAKAKSRRFKKPLGSQLFAYHVS
jgi:hypothetical protein